MDLEQTIKFFGWCVRSGPNRATHVVYFPLRLLDVEFNGLQLPRKPFLLTRLQVLDLLVQFAQLLTDFPLLRLSADVDHRLCRREVDHLRGGGRSRRNVPPQVCPQPVRKHKHAESAAVQSVGLGES